MQGMPKKNDMIVCSTDESAELSEKTKMVVIYVSSAFNQLHTISHCMVECNHVV